MNSPTEAMTRATAPAGVHDGSYADWPAILIGAVVAAAIVSVFSTFGTALGLSIISPYEGERSATAALIAVGLWMIWTTVSAVMAGGYIAGRMRRRVDTATADEVSVRDGIHGLAVWGVAVLFGAWLLGSTADDAVDAARQMAAPAGTAMETATDDGASSGDTAGTDSGMTVAAQVAKNYSIISAFVTGASLLIAAAGAYWAAGTGGRHRDETRVFARFGTWN
ncbi:MAG: hypothetical protein R3E44_09825 [Paracoccaceae bacterium]